MPEKSFDTSTSSTKPGSQTFDVIIIGGGPAGYQAAIRAAQFGMTVAIVESHSSLGGTCLNVGCIPSKHLLHVSHQYVMANNDWKKLGLSAKGISFDLANVMTAKTKVVDNLCLGVDGLMKKHAISRIVGTASLDRDGMVNVTDDSKKKTSLSGKRIVIATGSVSTNLPGADIDEETIVSSTGALSLKKVPKDLLIIGAGVIGLELGSVWQRFGSKVTVVEALPRILPGIDLATAKSMQRILTRQGMSFVLDSKVTSITRKGKLPHVKIVSKQGDKSVETNITPDIILVAIGRKPRTQELNLAEAGIACDDKGFVVVDAGWSTSRKNVYAVGDCIGGPMLAHKAGDEGIALIESWHGKASNLHYAMVPSIIYTSPECATIGLGEDELVQQNRSYRKGTFPFAANSRARISGDVSGQVCLLADDKTGRLLGAQIVGPEAGNMIHECVVAMEFGACVEDIALTCHGHPTYNEAIREAAFSLLDGAIHI